MFLFTKSWVIFKSSYPSLTQPPPPLPHHLLKVHSTLFTTLKLICDVEMWQVKQFHVRLRNSRWQMLILRLNSLILPSFSAESRWGEQPTLPPRKSLGLVRLSLFFLITHDTNEDEYECCWIDSYWPWRLQSNRPRRVTFETVPPWRLSAESPANTSCAIPFTSLKFAVLCYKDYNTHLLS